MPLKYKLNFLKPTWTSILVVTLLVLGLYQVTSYSTFPSQKKSNEVNKIDILSRTPNSFNHFAVEIQTESTDQNLVLQSTVDIQVALTISGSVEDLHLAWALQQDINITQSGLPTEPISFNEAQESPITYSAEIQITGDHPHIIVQAYTLADDGGKIGESAELYFNSNNGTYFLPNTLPEDEIKIRIDPSKIIR